MQTTLHNSAKRRTGCQRGILVGALLLPLFASASDVAVRVSATILPSCVVSVTANKSTRANEPPSAHVAARCNTQLSAAQPLMHQAAPTESFPIERATSAPPALSSFGETAAAGKFEVVTLYY